MPHYSNNQKNLLNIKKIYVLKNSRQAQILLNLKILGYGSAEKENNIYNAKHKG